MKRYNIFNSLLGLLLVFMACSDDTDPRYETGTFTKAAEIQSPQSGKEYVLTEESAENIFDTFVWQAADYGVPVGVEYRLELDSENNNFESPVVVASGITALTYPVKVKDINKAVTEFHTDFSVAAKVKIRVVSKAKGGETGTMELASFPETISEPLAISVLPYKAEMKREPIYFVGEIFGNSWNNNDRTMILFADDDKGDLKYTYTGYVEADSKFKLIKQLNSWDYQWGSSGTEGVLSTSGGDISGFAGSGYYTLTFNLSNNTYSIASYTGAVGAEYTNISLIGDFNSWSGDVDLQKSAFDKHIWFGNNIEIPSDGGVKIRVNHDWSVSFGGDNDLWKEEQGVFAVFNGGDNVPVKAGTYFVKFNDITKHIVLIKQ